MALNTYRLTIAYNSGGQFATNSLHYQFDDAVYITSATAADALITAFNTANLTKLRNMLPGAVTLLSYRANRVSAAGGFESTSVIAGGNVGNRIGTMMVSAVAPVLVGYEVLNGKRRARMFLPGVSVNDLDGGIFTAAFYTAINTIAGTFFDDLTLAGSGPPVAKNGTWDVKNRAFHQMDFWKLSDLPGTIRRRQLPV